eukprot:NODE_32_length_37098_cov_1.132760.p10 type:complete len:394 gc:universal NODE_32_length_37098_cov_1.132760:30069-28888(-)
MFKIHFNKFNKEFYEHAIDKLTEALNQKNKPQQIVDDITIEELDLGTLPPVIEILEISELDLSRFRGIFKVTYQGDGFLVIKTKIQANPFQSDRVVAASIPLIVPIKIRISRLRIRGIVGLVVDKSKGITCSMKNEPLESVLVSSSFDESYMIANFLQNEIEQKLQLLLTEELPKLIHEYSLRKFNQEAEKSSSNSSISTGTDEEEEIYKLNDDDLLNIQKRFASITEKFEDDSKSGLNEMSSIQSDSHSILSTASAGIIKRVELTKLHLPKSKSLDNDFIRIVNIKRPSVDKSIDLPIIPEINTSPQILGRKLSNLLQSNQSLSPYQRNYENSMFKSSPVKRRQKSVYSEKTSTMSRRSTEQMTLIKPKVRLKRKRTIDLRDMIAEKIEFLR